MDRAFASIAFSEASRLLQERYGSRRSYARLEKEEYLGGLTGNEIGFIESLDGFFLATTATSGYPYIQFRGGPKGFLKVLDSGTLGMADYAGNRQYITTGNLETNNKAALFLMDYASKTRLKLFATVSIHELNERPDLAERLMPKGYAAKAERIMLFHIQGYDWNCPQHITPRYTEEEVQEALQPLMERVQKLEKELEMLKKSSDPI
ncbi:MAG TPA: pyridoxamine 5'-phosphate oxidase family protein [Ohtaekwangia sp.]|uniref:pyridoxamine 5'-phosphate oxidase family protein n=1 Tax=Ohtaekwangia sp. TaxID=2066019 RepID=UPI002F91C564